MCDPIVPLSDMVDTINLLTSKSATIQQVTVEDVINTLSDLSLCSSQLPLSVQNILNSKHSSNNTFCCDINNHIIASNKIALDIAASVVKSEGYQPHIITDKLSGEAREVAGELIDALVTTPSKKENYKHLTKNMLNKINSAVSPDKNSVNKLCLIFGGETTVTKYGDGLGGRCQELAIAAAMKLDQVETQHSITLLATSTDGQDGPNDASGAVVNRTTGSEARKQGLDMDVCLRNNDSYNFFRMLKEEKIS